MKIFCSLLSRSLLVLPLLGSPALAGEKHIAATGDITIDDGELADVIGITNTTGAAINVFIPDARARVKRLVIVDTGINARAHSITVKPKAASGQTIMGSAEFVMDSNGASLTVTPWADGSGYY